MNEKKEKEYDDDDDDIEEGKKYINIDTSKIIYCLQCNVYIIYIKGMPESKNHYSSSSSSHCCDNCKNPHITNVFIDEAKVYFDSKNNTRKRKFIGTNCSNIKIRHYSRKII